MPAEYVAKPPVNFNTYVFFDLETTGLPPDAEITEISIGSVSKTSFKNYCTQQSCGVVDTKSVLPRALQTLTLQTRPRSIVSEDLWKLYDTSRASECSGLMSDHLRDLTVLKEQYGLLRAFLANLCPPLCFVAHNGNRFDYVILAREFCRNECEKLGIECYAVDSLPAFKQLDTEYIREIHLAIKPFTPNNTFDEATVRKQTPVRASVTNELERPTDAFGTPQTPVGVHLTSTCSTDSSSGGRKIYKAFMDGQLIQDDTIVTPKSENRGDPSKPTTSPTRSVKRKLFADDGDVKQELPDGDSTEADDIKAETDGVGSLRLVESVRKKVAIKLEIDDADDEFMAMVDCDGTAATSSHPDAASAEASAIGRQNSANCSPLPDRSDWSPAKHRIAELGTFRQSADGGWNFVSQKPPSYALGKQWALHFDGRNVAQPLAHSAQGDVQMMIMVCGQHGEYFIRYCENNAVPLDLNSLQPLVASNSV